MSLLYDSNVFIYQLNGVLGEYGQSLLKQGILKGAAFSVVTRIEVLGFNQSADALLCAKRLFSALQQIELSSAIVERTIALRQQRKIKIPDAIIAATALQLGFPLVTHNTSDFQWISDLILIDPLAEPES